VAPGEEGTAAAEPAEAEANGGGGEETRGAGGVSEPQPGSLTAAENPAREPALPTEPPLPPSPAEESAPEALNGDGTEDLEVDAGGADAGNLSERTGQPRVEDDERDEESARPTQEIHPEVSGCQNIPCSMSLKERQDKFCW